MKIGRGKVSCERKYIIKSGTRKICLNRLKKPHFEE